MFSNKFKRHSSRAQAVKCLFLLAVVLLSFVSYFCPAYAEDDNSSSFTSPQHNETTLSISPSSSHNVNRLSLLQRHKPLSRANTLHNIVIAGTTVTIFVPSGLTFSQPVQPLFIFHGMGGNGQIFSEELMGFAQANHILLLAPTFYYNPDYRNSQVVSKEDSFLTKKINQIASDVQSYLHVSLKQKFLLYGFSRGAQLAHRYALLYPQKTLGVVAISAGTYTLPLTTYNNTPLNFAFGTANLQDYGPTTFDKVAFDKVSFLIEVGADDTDTNAVSREWDVYEGTNRLTRAHFFASLLQQQGLNAQLKVFPHTGHEVTFAMNNAASKFFVTLLNS